MLLAVIAAATLANAPADYRNQANWICRPGRTDACVPDSVRVIVGEDGSITLTLNTLDPSVGDDGGMAKKPRTDRPRRRSFSPAEKLRLLAGYETATESGTGNAFLRENGLYSSLISAIRRSSIRSRVSIFALLFCGTGAVDMTP